MTLRFLDRITAVDLGHLGDTYGTPFFVTNLPIFSSRIRKVRACLPFCDRVLFAAKAHPTPAFLSAIRPLVDGLDVASEGELRLALRIGFPGSTLSLAGPAKTDTCLNAARNAGVWISCESLGELDRIQSLSTKVMIRINPTEPDLAYPFRLGGMPSPFGIDEADLDSVLTSYRAIRGVHVFAGSQARSARGVARAILRTIELGARASRQLGSLERIGLGGGFGIVEREGEQELDLESLATSISRDAVRKARDSMPGAEIVLELGRYLAGPAGLYVARVIDTRVSRGTHFTILDGGMNHMLYSTPTFGPPRPRLAVACVDRPKLRTTLVGPLCTPLDVLGRDVDMPSLRRGELVVFPNAGAYGLTASPALFLGHKTPSELLFDGDGFRLARAAVDPAEVGLPVEAS